MSNGWSTDYYKIPEGAQELQDLIEHKDMNFAVANIFKASYRLGDKLGTSAEYDLNKIIWFAQREIRRLQREQGAAPVPGYVWTAPDDESVAEYIRCLNEGWDGENTDA